jgi:cytoskeleton protein RodZ
MNSVGEILRTERESQSRSMADIAEELCLTQRYLRAIEQDDLQNLPGTFFYKSFVKQYAQILGIDASRLAPGVEALTAPAEPPALPGAPAGHRVRPGAPPIRPLDPIVAASNQRYFPDRRIGLPLAGLVAVLLVCSSVYAWWNRTPQHYLTARATPPIALPAQAPVAVAVNAPIAVAQIAAEQLTATPPEEDGLSRVVLNLSATEATWLSITSGGKQIFSGVLQPDQTKTLRGLDAAQIKVGNAGGLEVLWNGKPIGPIGPRGQVRTVLITPENFQILEPSQTL